MRLIVSGIPEEGLSQKFDLPVSITDKTGKVTAHVQTSIRRYGDRVLVEGTAEMPASFECSRCLTKFTSPIDIRFLEEYLPAPKTDGDADKELTRKELNLNYYYGDEIDICRLVEEQLQLAVPMKPLCRENCPGICPGCGINRNKGACGCSNHGIDPRLMPLKRLKDSMR